jgi:5-methylcytosine-specific restriction endonuclease McrA
VGDCERCGEHFWITNRRQKLCRPDCSGIAGNRPSARKAKTAKQLREREERTAEVRALGGRERIRRELSARDGNHCGICGDPLDANVEIDHLLPRSRGGRTVLENLQLTHAACNLARGASPR